MKKYHSKEGDNQGEENKNRGTKKTLKTKKQRTRTNEAALVSHFFLDPGITGKLLLSNSSLKTSYECILRQMIC